MEIRRTKPAGLPKEHAKPAFNLLNGHVHYDGGSGGPVISVTLAHHRVAGGQGGAGNEGNGLLRVLQEGLLLGSESI